MRNELNVIEHIEKYLRNELSVEDKEAFEAKLKTDANLQKEVALQKDVIKGIERIGAKQSIQTASRRYENRRRGFFLGLALLLAVSGVVGISNYSNEDKVKELSVLDSIETIKEVGAEEIEVGNGEESAQLENLTETEQMDAVKLPAKKFQYFTINSSKDESLVGEEGTIIEIKANSFNVPQNSQLKVRLKEYYKASDIAFSNLTTETKDGKLLETGGMIYIDAKLDGKEVQLKKGEEIGLKFPFEKKKEGMKLFDGELKDEKMVWNEVTKNNNVVVEEFNEVIDDEVFTIVEQMPEFKGGQKKLFEFLRKNIKYPPEARIKRLSGKVYVNFIVGEDGKLRDVKILRGVDKLLDKEALRVIQNMPRWSPGKQRGKNVAVSYIVPINFSLGGAVGLGQGINSFNDSLVSEDRGDIEKELLDTLSGDVKGNNDRIKTEADINYYVLASSGLGWINCDRFTRNNAKRITFKVNAKTPMQNIKLIFHSVRGIMRGYQSQDVYKFNRVPIGEKVAIFAVKFIKNKPFICLLETKTSNKVVQLEFEELTKEKLQEYVKQIDKI